MFVTMLTPMIANLALISRYFYFYFIILFFFIIYRSKKLNVNNFRRKN